MPKVNVNIQPTVLHWVMDQMQDENIGNQLRDHIAKWLDGSKTPTFNQIQELSKKSHIPLGYFFLKVPPVEDIRLLEFRTIDSLQLAKPSRNLIDTIHIMEERQDWMADYRKDREIGPLSLVGAAKNLKYPAQMAAVIRKTLGLTETWSVETDSIRDSFNTFRKALENVGILVMMSGVVSSNTHRVLNIEEFRAFALINKWAPLIFVNGADSQGGRLFSLLHEAAHIWYGQDDLFNDLCGVSDKPVEMLCNAVAAELLVPENKFSEAWNISSVKDVYKKISSLALKFHCGETVIARRALDFGKIDKDTYKKIATDAIERFREEKEVKGGGGNFYGTAESRLDGAFMRAVCDSVSSGLTSYTDAYRLTNTSRKTFDKVAADLGGILW